MERAEYIKSVIDGQVTVPQASGTGQKARPNGAGGGGGGDKDGVRIWRSSKSHTSHGHRGSNLSSLCCSLQQDAEKDKLRSALGSAIMVETPNIKVLVVPCMKSVHRGDCPALGLLAYTCCGAWKSRGDRGVPCSGTMWRGWSTRKMR